MNTVNSRPRPRLAGLGLRWWVKLSRHFVSQQTSKSTILQRFSNLSFKLGKLGAKREEFTILTHCRLHPFTVVLPKMCFTFHRKLHDFVA